MVFFIARALVFWAAWILLADKKRWREILPICLLGALLGSITDTIMHHYPLWEYFPHSIFVDLLDDFSVYLVTIYFFIQWLPKKRTIFRMIIYIFPWSIFASIVEYVHLWMDKMVYHQWWNHGFSYTADWLLFFVFYLYYEKLRFNRLSNESPDLERSLEYVEDIIFVVDREGKLIRSHGKWLRKHGIFPGENKGKPIEEYVGEGNDFTVHYRALQSALEGKATIYEWTWHLPKLGRSFQFQTSVSPLQSVKGDIIGAIGVAREMTTPPDQPNNDIDSSSTALLI